MSSQWLFSTTFCCVGAATEEGITWFDRINGASRPRLGVGFQIRIASDVVTELVPLFDHHFVSQAFQVLHSGQSVGVNTLHGYILVEMDDFGFMAFLATMEKAPVELVNQVFLFAESIYETVTNLLFA